MNTAERNINEVERKVSIILGGALLLRSLGRLSFSGIALAIPLLYRGISGHSYLYQALGINTAGENKQPGDRGADDALEVERSITIQKPADELYRLWRDPQNLARIMQGFIEVTPASGDRLHWQLRGPLDLHLEWDTQIVEDRPGNIVRWQSPDGEIPTNEGAIHFREAPQDWGTEVTLHLRFTPFRSTFGNSIVKKMKLLPRLFAEKALRSFKSLAETGELPTLKCNPAARADAYAEYSSTHHEGEQINASPLLERYQ